MKNFPKPKTFEEAQARHSSFVLKRESAAIVADSEVEKLEKADEDRKKYKATPEGQAAKKNTAEVHETIMVIYKTLRL